jgi:Cft2 family RNA processing exonuclease
MQVHFHRAAGDEVTGSAYQLQTDDANVLIDFGMFQGARMAESRNRVPAALNAKKLNAVLLTHAHLDHCGRLPLLVKRGFSGPIYATQATLEIAELILRDAAKIQLIDMESTYGDHDHRPLDDTIEEFTALVKRLVANKGKLLVPSFAVGRTQQLLYHLAVLFREKVVPTFPVFVDSPMAVKATRIYAAHPELGDEEFQELRKVRALREDLATAKGTITAEESRKLNDVRGPCLILAGAGMCNAGRILHHLKNNLWRPETIVAIVGYQAPGSLGRKLVEHQPFVRILGERIAVKAEVRTLARIIHGMVGWDEQAEVAVGRRSLSRSWRQWSGLPRS